MSDATEARKRRAERRQGRSETAESESTDNDAAGATSDASPDHGSVGEVALELLRRAASPTTIGAAAGAVAAAKLAGSGKDAARDGSGAATERAKSQPEPRDDRPAAADERDNGHPEASSSEGDEASDSDDAQVDEPGRQPSDVGTPTDRDAEAALPQQEDIDADVADRSGPTQEGLRSLSDTQARILGRASAYATQLTGRKVDCFSAVERHDGRAWRVAVEIVEVPRIPSSTDVLASYELVLDDDGSLLEYRRTRRYHRNVPSQEHYG